MHLKYIIKCVVYGHTLFSFTFFSLQGSLEIFTGLGLILGPPLGGWFYQAFGYEVPFLILGCLLMLMVPFNIYVLPSIGSVWDCRRVCPSTWSGKIILSPLFPASTSAEATSSKDSFLRLLTKPKVVLICYVIFTLSAGLGFLDATLSLFAIDTVVTILNSPVRPSICVCLTIYCLSLRISSNSYLAPLGSSCLVCPFHIVWLHPCWVSLLTNIL